MTSFNFTSKAKAWKGIISLMNTMKEEAMFIVTSAGLEINCINEGRVAMFDLQWPSTSLKEYACDGDIKVGFSTKLLNEIVKRFDKESEITFTWGGEGMIKLSDGSKHYQMALIAADLMEPAKKVHVELEISAPMTLDMLKKIITDLQFINDAALFEVKDGMFSVSAIGDTARASIPIFNDMTPTFTATAEYNLPYLSDVVSCMEGVAEISQIQFGTAKPLYLKIVIEDLGVMNYFLSPYLGNL